MLRLLGQSEYGLYSLIGSLVGYFSILDMGLGTAIVRYTARNRGLGDKLAESKLNGMFIILYSIIGLLTVIIGIVLYINIENMFRTSLASSELEKAKIMMVLLIFNFAISFPLGVFGSIVQAYEKFIFIRMISIIRTVINPLFILPLLLLGYGSVSMVVVNTVLNISFLLINLVYCFKVLKVKIRFSKIDIGILKEIAGYSFFIFLNIIVDKIYWSTGQFILGIVSGTAKVAVYSIAMQFTNMYMLFSTSISGVLLPKISIMVANNATNEELSELLIKIGRVQYIIMSYIIIGFILFGQGFINLWAGPNYIDAYYIVLLIMIPITIPLIQTVGLSILQAKNLHGFRSIVYICIAIVNVIVSISLAKIWGGFGTAVATGLSLLLGNVLIMNYYYHRKIGLNIPLFWKNILLMTLPAIISLIVGFGMNYIILNNTVYLLVIKIMLFSILHICLMWRLAFNSYEKELFYQPVKKILYFLANKFLKEKG
jgi:O-antigen/teichoic acid export membrane protein